MTLVAMSAAYGAAGSEIGPAVAQRLGVPFVDRAVAVQIAERLEIPVDAALAHEEPVTQPSLMERLLAGFAGADASGPAPVPAEVVTDEDFHQALREVLLAQAQTGQGVILGRGAAAALRDDPRVLRVRLSGPAPRRVEQAMRLGGVDRDTAKRALKRLDRAHADYLREFYDADPDDTALYHLIIDSTEFSTDFCVRLILEAAAERNRA